MQMVFCPACGRRLARKEVEARPRSVCDLEPGGCGFIDYGHFTLGVGGLILNMDPSGEGRILLIQRNIEPNRGGWTIPGGYVERDETAETAVVREIAEETGLQCKLAGLIGYRNRVDIDINTSYVVFLLEVIGGNLFTEPTSETAQAGFYTLGQIETLSRVAPLSQEMAVAALTRRLKILKPMTIPNWNDRPSFTLFIG